MTVAYAVSVPRGTVVRTNSDSGETTIAGVSGKVSVRTESASIRVRDLSGDVDVKAELDRAAQTIDQDIADNDGYPPFGE